LAGLLAQVEELGAAHARVLDHLDLGDRRTVHREGALDADALAQLAHGEAPAQPAAADVDDLATEFLLPLLVALDHAHRHLDGVTRAQVGTIGLQLSGLDLLDQAHVRAPFWTERPGTRAEIRSGGL